MNKKLDYLKQGDKVESRLYGKGCVVHGLWLKELGDKEYTLYKTSVFGHKPKDVTLIIGGWNIKVVPFSDIYCIEGDPIIEPKESTFVTEIKKPIKAYIDKIASNPPENAMRDNKGKLPLDELDPIFLEEMFAVILYGQKKYARLNWTKGAPATQYMGCIMRHLLKWYKGEDVDEESGCTHLGHIACNVMMAMYSLRTRPELDDRPFKGVKNE